MKILMLSYSIMLPDKVSNSILVRQHTSCHLRVNRPSQGLIGKCHMHTMNMKVIITKTTHFSFLLSPITFTKCFAFMFGIDNI